VGRNILYTAMSIEDIARETRRSADDVVAALGRARPAMFYERARRPRPQLDDKVLTAWNGLMIAAFSRAARVLADRPLAGAYLDSARRAAAFLRDVMWDPTRQILRRRYRGGDAAIDGYCEDYAYLVFGLLELFQADGDAGWLEWALRLQARQDELFGDARGGWFSTTGQDPTVLLRLREDYDGAEPAAGSVGALNLLVLAHLTGREEVREGAERALASLDARGSDAARIAPFMAAALSTYHAGTRQVVVAGGSDDPVTRAMGLTLARRYLPFTLVISLRAEAPGERLAVLAPFLAGMKARGGRPTAYVCRDFRCDAPVDSPEALDALLGPAR